MLPRYHGFSDSVVLGVVLGAVREVVQGLVQGVVEEVILGVDTNFGIIIST